MNGSQLLLKWRQELGLRQTDAAELIEISPSALSDYERGLKSPGVRVALRMAAASHGAIPVESWGDAA